LPPLKRLDTALFSKPSLTVRKQIYMILFSAAILKHGCFVCLLYPISLFHCSYIFLNILNIFLNFFRFHFLSFLSSLPSLFLSFRYIVNVIFVIFFIPSMPPTLHTSFHSPTLSQSLLSFSYDVLINFLALFLLPRLSVFFLSYIFLFFSILFFQPLFTFLFYFLR